MIAVRVKLTPPAVASRFGVSPDKVLAWIKAGELRAINIATKATGRPRYVVDEADLALFEQARTANPKPATSPRRRKPAAGVIEFFKA